MNIHLHLSPRTSTQWFHQGEDQAQVQVQGCMAMGNMVHLDMAMGTQYPLIHHMEWDTQWWAHRVWDHLGCWCPHPQMSPEGMYYGYPPPYRDGSGFQDDVYDRDPYYNGLV